MRRYQFFLWVMGFGLSIQTLHAQSMETDQKPSTEEWNIHQSKEKYDFEKGIFPPYHRKKRLYPSKHTMNNPLRKKGWQTHPDPYIEEGGVYTHSEHPAETDDQSTMRDYTTGTPNNYVVPPSILLDKAHHHQSQQKVQITDPSHGYVPPITLPPL